MSSRHTIAVIGGGAAGFFAANSAAFHHPKSQVFLFEKSQKLLSKVKVSGGGRCNVTHHCFDNKELVKFYPRGEKFLKKAFEQFSVSDTIHWYEKRGVRLKVEEDNRMFPVSDNSQSIIDALMQEAQKLNVEIRIGEGVDQLSREGGIWVLKTTQQTIKADKVIIASGGSPKKDGLKWLEDLGHEIVDPIPSLFTFNLPKNSITELMGLSVPQAQVHIQGSKFESLGPLLITHWGMSGPAILKLSAFAARFLNEHQYHFHFQVNWLGTVKEHELRASLASMLEEVKKRKISNRNPFALPQRLWDYFLVKSEIDPEKTWQELPKKSLNKLINCLLNDVYEAKGKTTFKEEFVTAGGVALTDVDPNTMQSKKQPNLYFAGEVLDVDGVTGGFNFQAAWTTGFIAGKAL